jgi:hypothetical protein
VHVNDASRKSRPIVKMLGASSNADDTSSSSTSSSSNSRRRVLTGLATAIGSLVLPQPFLPIAHADDLFCGYYKENLTVTPQWAFKTPWSEGFVDTSGATNLKVGLY